jgi:hypothetical protein
MHFTRTDTFPTALADVQILFTGLLLLVPQDDGSCLAGVDHVAPDHELTINVTERGTGTSVATLPGSLQLPLLITIDPPTRGAVAKYTSLPEPFDRTDTRDLRDIRWSIDFKTLYPQMGVQTDKVTPGITLTDGLLYTATPTDPNDVTPELVAPDGSLTDLHRIGAVIGANIYLEQGQSVLLEWTTGAGPQQLRLPQPKNVGGGYAISIANEPPEGAPVHNDFQEYYNIITNVRPDQEYDLVFIPKSPALGLTLRQPCASGLGDGDDGGN